MKYLRLTSVSRPTLPSSGEKNCEIVHDGRLEYSSFPGGYFDPAGGAMYYVTDWQGNNVAVVDKDGKVMQRTVYYPDGEPTIEPAGQRYLFGGKEFESRQGLNLYDFLARTYSPDEARFWQPDPKADDYHWLSPYVYCAGVMHFSLITHNSDLLLP